MILDMRPVTCRKISFPIECPRCHSWSGRPNGVRRTLALGPRQQVRCGRCRKQWLLPSPEVPPLFLFYRKRVRVQPDLLLQSFALVVLGIPLCRVEELVEIKAETVQAKLSLVLHRGRWQELDVVLEARFKLPRSFRSDFHTVFVEGAEFGEDDFFDWAIELRRRNRAYQAKVVHWASRILGREVKRSEIIAWS
jgi:hypothetical protein